MTNYEVKKALRNMSVEDFSKLLESISVVRESIDKFQIGLPVEPADWLIFQFNMQHKPFSLWSAAYSIEQELKKIKSKMW